MEWDDLLSDAALVAAMDAYELRSTERQDPNPNPSPQPRCSSRTLSTTGSPMGSVGFGALPSYHPSGLGGLRCVT